MQSEHPRIAIVHHLVCFSLSLSKVLILIYKAYMVHTILTFQMMHFPEVMNILRNLHFNGCNYYKLFSTHIRLYFSHCHGRSKLSWPMRLYLNFPPLWFFLSSSFASRLQLYPVDFCALCSLWHPAPSRVDPSKTVVLNLLILWPFNTAPHVVVTPSHRIIFGCYSITVILLLLCIVK